MSSHTFSPMWVAALPGLLAVGIWAVTRVERFVTFAVMSAMILPIALAQPGGTQVALADVLLLVALFAWLVAGSLRLVPGPQLRGNSMLLPAVLFLSVNAVSLAWSDNVRATIVFTIQLFEFVILFPVVFASLPRSIRDIRYGFYFFITCSCVLAVYTTAKYAGRAGSGSLQGQDLAGGLNKNVIGSFVAAGLVIAYTLWLGERRGTTTRRVLAVAGIVELAGLVSTVSRGSLIGTFVAIIASSLLLGRNRLVTFAGVAIVMLAYLTVIGVSSHADRTQSGSYDSSVVRHYSFHNAVEKIRDKPLLGTGGGTYTDYIEQLEFYLPDPNNMFLLEWAEVGIVGLLAWLFLLARYLQLLVRVRSLPDAYATPAVASGCVTLSLFIHFQFDVTWTRGTSSLAFAMIGLMLAARRLASAPSASDAQPPGPASTAVGPSAVLVA